MYYHEIKTILTLHEFDIIDRLLKCQMTKIVITRIQYTFQWYFPCETKVAKCDPYINSDCDQIFWITICHQKATLQAIPEYLSEFRVFCATKAFNALQSIYSHQSDYIYLSEVHKLERNNGH